MGPVMDVPKARQVSGEVIAISAPVERASDSNSRLKGQVGILQDQAKAAREQADAAVQDSGRLAAAGHATQKELDDLWKSLQQLQTRNLFLETELARTSELLTDQSAFLADARQKLTTAVSSAGAADLAAKLCESQLTTVTSQFITEKTKSDALAFRVAAQSAQIAALWWWIWRGAIFVTVYAALRIIKLTPWGRPWLFFLP